MEADKCVMLIILHVKKLRRVKLERNRKGDIFFKKIVLFYESSYISESVISCFKTH